MKKYGFSLIECLITLTILSVFITIGVPGYEHHLQKIKSDLLAKQLVMSLQFAVNTAAAKHTSLSVCHSKTQTQCDGEWRDGWIVFLDASHSGKVSDAADILLKIKSEVKDGNLELRSFPDSRDYLQIGGSIFSETDNGTFRYFSRGKKTSEWSVVINKAGEVSYS